MSKEAKKDLGGNEERKEVINMRLKHFTIRNEACICNFCGKLIVPQEPYFVGPDPLFKPKYCKNCVLKFIKDSSVLKEASLIPDSFKYHNAIVKGELMRVTTQFGEVLFITRMTTKHFELPAFYVWNHRESYEIEMLVPLNRKATEILAYLKMAGITQWKVVKKRKEVK